MKFKIILISLLTLSFTLSTTSASAHMAGQPSFFKVNGQYANLYPVPLSSLYNFDLPQDLAPENYLQNEPINFELDKSRLPAPPDVIEKTKFSWDFTDGTHDQGLKLTHTFTSMGSYILKIYADDGTTPKPQIIESILINVKPNKDYQLPQAKILVNGKETKDPLTDISQSDFKTAVTLDGSKSSSSITEYFWDFGDQKSASGPTQTHTYASDLSQTFVVLRVKDANGFIGDTFVEIQNSQNEKPVQPAPKKVSQLPFTALGIIFIIILATVLRFVLGRRHGKRR